MLLPRKTVSLTGLTLKETPLQTSTPQPFVNAATEHTVTVRAAAVTKCFRLTHQ